MFSCIGGCLKTFLAVPRRSLPFLPGKDRFHVQSGRKEVFLRDARVKLAAGESSKIVKGININICGQKPTDRQTDRLTDQLTDLLTDGRTDYHREIRGRI